MSGKYAQEMILIPKPSEEEQSGGQVDTDNMDQFWQRRLLVDQLTTAPHVDRMMQLLQDMKQVEGRAVPSTLPGQGPNSSDYFRLQGQLKNIPPQPVKCPLAPKTVFPSSPGPPPPPPPPPKSTRPLPPRRFKKPFSKKPTLRKSSKSLAEEPRRKWRKRYTRATMRPSRRPTINGGLRQATLTTYEN